MDQSERQAAWEIINRLHRETRRLIENKDMRDVWLEHLENYTDDSQEDIDYLKRHVADYEKRVEESKEAAKGAFAEFRKHFGPDLGI